MSGYNASRSAYSAPIWREHFLRRCELDARVLQPLASTNSAAAPRVRGRRARRLNALTGTAQPSPTAARARPNSYVQPAPSKTYNTLNLCLQARSRARNPARPHAHTCARAPPQLRRPHQIRVPKHKL